MTNGNTTTTNQLEPEPQEPQIVINRTRDDSPDGPRTLNPLPSGSPPRLPGRHYVLPRAV